MADHHRPRAGVTAELHLPSDGLTVVASPPALVSQRTVEVHLGIHRRAFLESLPSYRASGGEVLSLGWLRLVEPGAYLAWLRTRGDVEPANDPSDQDDGESVAEIIAATGYRLAKGCSSPRKRDAKGRR